MSIRNQIISDEDIFTWIEKELKPISCTSEEFIYDDMESQSGYSLPIVYQPFDATNKLHWDERGSIYDFLYSTKSEGKKVLDFGPGDGWPSLLIAPFAKEVIGVDASEKRVEVCRKNAKRMKINNASFVSYKADARLPFEDNSFDGVMAASSIEQTPNPKKTIEELYRILKPGGRMRIHYEALNMYRDGFEKDLWLEDISDSTCKLILYNRDVENEYVMQYALTINMSHSSIISKLSSRNNITFEQITISFLEEIRPMLSKAQVCKTLHPSGKTLAKWLKEAGFKEILPTHSGKIAAIKLFEQYSDEDRPSELYLADEVIKKAVRIVTELEAPIESDPMLTVVK